VISQVIVPPSLMCAGNNAVSPLFMQDFPLQMLSRSAESRRRDGLDVGSSCVEEGLGDLEPAELLKVICEVMGDRGMISIQTSPNVALPPAALAGFPTNLDADSPVVLVADDECLLTSEIADYLARYGMRALVANTFAEALGILTSRKVDAVVLDQRFGPVDTLPLLPQLRAVTDAPILVHTGNRDETDRVLGLELGADDFLLKPVSGRELVARLRARFRRPAPRALPPMLAPAPLAAAPLAPAATPASPAATPTGWRIATAERRVYRPDGAALKLTSAEYDTFAALAATPGEVHSRDALTRLVFRREWRPGDRAIDNAVLHLRQKLAEDLGEGCIVTVRQLGYLFPGFPPA
jgi:DNA-binding response OmpR family regulator